MTDTNRAAAVFKSLSHDTRLKILMMLNTRPRSVGEIVDLFSLSQPTISRHLVALKQAGLVVSRRRGQQVIYAINEEGLKEHLLDFFRHFDCLRAATTGAQSRRK